jgi:hypothetical protein
MSPNIGRHWIYSEASQKECLLRLFGMIGLKKNGKAYMGPSPEQLFEANGSISADISDKSAKLHDSHGLSKIMINSHTALLLFFENVLTVQVLAAAIEDEQSIFAKLFNVPLVIQDNPEYAIAYYDPNGLPLAA